MQFPKLTPLQSRFVASFAASLLLVIFYLALSNPHFAYASDVESIAHKDYNHPLSLGVTVPEEDLEGLEDDREGRPPRYEPEFAALGRSIIGRAPDTESPQSLSNNAPGKQNIAQGGSQFWVFPKAALSGPLASTIPVLPSEFGKRNITPWSERQEDDIGGPELKGRQAEGSTLYVTLNTCDQPSASAGSPAAAPLQLRLFVSQSVQNPGPNTPTLAIREVEVNQGFGTYQVSPISDDFYLGVFAPPDSSGFTGNYSYEITASIDASYTSYKEQPSLYLVDSDTNAGLLVSNNITTANETDPQYKQWMNARPPFGIFIHNQNDSSIRGLERSLCGLKNHAQIQGNIPGMDSTKVEVGMTTIGGGKPKQQFYVQGLNGSSSYYAIMVIGSEYSTSGPANVGGGGAVWTAANFSTKSGMSLHPPNSSHSKVSRLTQPPPRRELPSNLQPHLLPPSKLRRPLESKILPQRHQPRHLVRHQRPQRLPKLFLFPPANPLRHHPLGAILPCRQLLHLQRLLPRLALRRHHAALHGLHHSRR